MKRPLELAVDHMLSIDSAFSLDLKILTAGFADAASRIEALEKIVASLQQPAKPSVSTGW